MKHYKFIGTEYERLTYVENLPEMDRDRIYSEEEVIGDYKLKDLAKHEWFSSEWQEVDVIMEGTVTFTNTESFEEKLGKQLVAIKELLLAKNRKYGNSALEPSNIFSKLPAKEGLLVRIDDKLKRIGNGSYRDGDEDVVTDLIGYLLILKMIDDENTK